MRFARLVVSLSVFLSVTVTLAEKADTDKGLLERVKRIEEKIVPSTDQRWNIPTVHGSFVGHIVPGLGFALIGLRVFGQFIYEHTMLKDRRYLPLALHASLDVLLWLLATTVGIGGEFHNGQFWSHPDQSPNGYALYAEVTEGDPLLHYNFNNVQHIQLYSVFLLVAMAAQLERSWPQHTPKHAGMLMLILAFTIDSFQWYIHSIAKETVHCMQHMLFCLLSLATALTCCAELVTRERRLLALRAFFLVLTGTWFLTAAVLMKTSWPIDLWYKDKDDRITWDVDIAKLPAGSMMMMNAALFSHEAVTLVILGAILFGIVQAILVRYKLVRSPVEYQMVTHQDPTCDDVEVELPQANSSAYGSGFASDL